MMTFNPNSALFIFVFVNTGLQANIPTLMVWEAVLFYVDEDAVRNIMKELFDFSKSGGNGDNPRAETMLCFTGMY